MLLDDHQLMPYVLTERQREAARRIAAVGEGAWARALVDGSAEVFIRHQGGLIRFDLDSSGATTGRETLPPTTRFLTGRRLVITLLVAAGLAGAELGRRELMGAGVGMVWLLPIGLAVAAYLVAAYSFGIYARLPRATWDAGPWTGFPGEPDDWSGYTMPGLVRAFPLIAAFMLAFCLTAGVIGFRQELGGNGAGWIGLGVGAFVWWAATLAASRGWLDDDG